MKRVSSLSLNSWLILVGFLCSACATTEFKAYEAKNNRFEGQGGTKTIVEGIEFWDNGEPPRIFKVLGIIEDQRPGGMIPMSHLHTDIAEKAKKVGGDAVIALTNNSQVVGHVSQSSANTNTYGSTTSTYGTAMAFPARRNYAKFAVIKFLD